MIDFFLLKWLNITEILHIVVKEFLINCIIVFIEYKNIFFDK